MTYIELTIPNWMARLTNQRTMFATRNLRRQCFKSVPRLLQNPPRAMDPRRSLPAARVGQQGRNRGLARHTILYFLGTGPCGNGKGFLNRSRILRESVQEGLDSVKGDPELEPESNSDEEYIDDLSKYDGPELCEVCMKVVDHVPCSCPFLVMIPNPENTSVGEGYKILCHCCHRSDPGHPDGSWTGYAVNESWSTRNAHFVQISDAAVNYLRRVGPQSRI